ncbi:hypothetical protein GW750_01280 [bacterium]|nr:hypothetical protein [bacterium]
MSWFLVGAIIDVSTIMTVSLGAFPSLVINQDQQLQATLQNQKVRLPKKVLLNFQNT